MPKKKKTVSAPPTSHPKFTAEVVHYEDEKLVGIVVDYKTAAVVEWLLGECSANCPTTSTFYDKLGGIREVEAVYDKICEELTDEAVGSIRCPNFNFMEDWEDKP